MKRRFVAAFICALILLSGCVSNASFGGSSAQGGVLAGGMSYTKTNDSISYSGLSLPCKIPYEDGSLKLLNFQPVFEKTTDGDTWYFIASLDISSVSEKQWAALGQGAMTVSADQQSAKEARDFVYYTSLPTVTKDGIFYVIFKTGPLRHSLMGSVVTLRVSIRDASQNPPLAQFNDEITLSADNCLKALDELDGNALKAVRQVLG